MYSDFRHAPWNKPSKVAGWKSEFQTSSLGKIISGVQAVIGYQMDAQRVTPEHIDEDL